ncbi:MAG: hypothetical protein WCY30_06070 [Candidatus Neomarinimicrobiota bacterium]|jgi:hypothetical protein
MKKGKHSIIKWTARILALIVIGFGLPFYFGYGNPLPFINPEYTIWDNTWLTIFPLMFIGLGLGWKFEKTGGFLVSVPILIGFVIGLIFESDLSLHMIIPLLTGVLYIISGFTKENI